MVKISMRDRTRRRLGLRGRRRPNTGATHSEHPDREWAEMDWNQHVRGAAVRGRYVHYVDVGTGRPVVLTHGQGGAWQWWLRVIPAVARHHRVIALDLAGFGASEPVGAGDVFEEQVATVVGLLDELRLAKATIVGHSMGGLVSLKVACDHPHRVDGLMLIGSGSNIMGPARLRAILLGFRLFDRVFRFPTVPRIIVRWRRLRAAFFKLAVAETHHITRSLAAELVPRMAAPGFIAGMEAAGKAVGEATPEAVRAPALVVWGRGDRIVPLSSGRQLAAAIPDAQLVVLDDVAHCAMLEKPAETAALIIDFVRDPRAGRAARDSATDVVDRDDSQAGARIAQWENTFGEENWG
ncbi:alpha/beta hydrolase [Mycobacterium kiyosense]|uniref:Alpha/beta hydrolase n=2 Tax=Mycobacteriaceae TaxID=1762 RepID=A0A9P3Q4Q0_9MYCO|nr:alpha/beta hydrolase [Mycobacterium sp. 20KCMC460]GLB80868.1 alpha/beta hydrolase [Mycobacterium kiyosense]GLB87394.1 alpha/beta hydrolase [Mycobacterium kiyosense]GLB93348.1 alpha/beta hydrolase [Mycobacterium kiyosense]GLB99556.1 alpha/beta hydrolase [Mycobacterium kiyosense]